MRMFNNAWASAQECSLSERHFRRLSDQLKIKPVEFHAKHVAHGGRSFTYKWTPTQIAQIKEVAMKNKKKRPTKGY